MAHSGNMEHIRGRLPDGTRFYLFRELDSTNRMAEEWWADGVAEHGIIVAEVQRSGRGRLGRRWESRKGGLYFSEIITPPAGEEHMRRLSLIGLAAAVSVAACLGSYLERDFPGKGQRTEHEPGSMRCPPGAPFGLKWPNDVLYVDGPGNMEKKICGILQRYLPGGTNRTGDERHAVILGVGINISNTIPADAAPRAVSLKEIISTANVPGPLEFLGRWHGMFMELYGRFERGEFGEIVQAWNELALTPGKEVRIETVPGIVEGLARGIRDDGALELDLDDGTRRFITAGDCIHLR